jgi:radical SAM-linked protein
MRIRLIFAKSAPMRFTSHLDLHRTWERTLRRAGLPLVYSQGYNPRPRINLASALPLGFTGEREVADIWLEKQLTLPEIENSIIHALPPGLSLIQISEVDQDQPSLQATLQASEYKVTCLEKILDLENRLRDLCLQGETIRYRRGKEYDLKPLILDLKTMPNNENADRVIFMRLSALEGATGRPEEVLSALGIQSQDIRVTRIRLIFECG